MQTDTMTRECTALHSYLLGGLPGRYVVEKYVAAHKQLPALTHSAGWFDGFMLTASQVHPVLLRLVQVYARIFAPASLCRKKAVLLLAIVECCAPSLVSIQAPRTRSPAHAILLSILTVAWFALTLIVATIVLAPVQLGGAAAARAARAVSPRAPAVSKVV